VLEPEEGSLELDPELPVEPELLEPLELEPRLPLDEPVEEDGLPLELCFFIAASNSERLSRPSASVSAALKSSPGTEAASLESM
jgi:hypothetical protein